MKKIKERIGNIVSLFMIVFVLMLIVAGTVSFFSIFISTFELILIAITSLLIAIYGEFNNEAK